MSDAPSVDIDLSSFKADPYPTLALLRREAPVAFVLQLGSTLLTRLDDIVLWEKRIDVFSSHQPLGLMNRLMGRIGFFQAARQLAAHYLLALA